MKHIYYILALIILSVAAAIVVFSTIIMTIPIQVVTFNKFEVLNNPKKGDFITYRIDLDKHYDLPAKANWFLINGVIYQLAPGRETIRRPVGNTKDVKQFYIPDDLSVPCGKYKLRLDLTYKIGFLRDITQSIESNDFNLICKTK